MPTMHLDFETRSDCNLPKTGVDVYCEHPTTDIWLACWCIDDGPINTWHQGDKLPKEFIDHVTSGQIVMAHNASFEWNVWNKVAVPKYGWPKLKLEQTYCTAAMAFAMAIPASLEKSSKALGLEMKKDMKGARVMMQLMRPRSYDVHGDPIWWDDEEKLKILEDYCRQDVRVEKQLEARLKSLSKKERQLWLVDQKINNRGIQVDTKGVEMAIRLAEQETARLDKEMAALTKGAVGSARYVSQLKQWLEWQGVETDSVSKNAIKEILARDDLKPEVRQACEIRAQVGKSSVAKFKALQMGTSSDGRIKGLMQYHAASTGRWGGRRFQPQNLPRPSLSQEDIDHAADSLSKGDASAKLFNLFYGDVLPTLSDCIRSMLVAPEDKVLVGCDYSAIEARVLPWLAGEESVLKVFRGDGKIYEHAAAQIYKKNSKEVTSEERQIGKVATLALGYGGGKGAFKSMAEVYGKSVSDDLAEDIKIRWRDSHKRIVKYWGELETAAKNAVMNPGKAFKAGAVPVSFGVKGSFLFCKLPSGRFLCYPYPAIKPAETPWGEMRETLTYKSVDVSYNFVRVKSYGGLLSENVTQAVARDILAEALLRLDKHEYLEPVLHVHDEIICEATAGLIDLDKVLEAQMNILPDWAEGLPIKSEAWVGRRYRK